MYAKIIPPSSVGAAQKCLAVCPRQKGNFVPWQWISAKFSGAPQLLANYILTGEQDPGANGSGCTQKVGFYHIYLLPRFWSEGFMSYLFGIRMMRQKGPSGPLPTHWKNNSLNSASKSSKKTDRFFWNRIVSFETQIWSNSVSFTSKFNQILIFDEL